MCGNQVSKTQVYQEEEKQAAGWFSEKAVWKEKKHICRSKNISVQGLESPG